MESGVGGFMGWLMKSSTAGLARGAVNWPSDNSTHMDCSTLSTLPRASPGTHLGWIGQFVSAKAWALPVCKLPVSASDAAPSTSVGYACM